MARRRRLCSSPPTLARGHLLIPSSCRRRTARARHWATQSSWARSPGPVRADSGLIAALVILEALSNHDGGLADLVSSLDRYAASGEINTTVDDAAAVMDHVADVYSAGEQDQMDGLTVDMGDWWFNLRPSNTEPLLRLNLEAADDDEVARRVDEVRAHFAG